MRGARNRFLLQACCLRRVHAIVGVPTRGDPSREGLQSVRRDGVRPRSRSSSPQRLERCVLHPFSCSVLSSSLRHQTTLLLFHFPPTVLFSLHSHTARPPHSRRTLRRPPPSSGFHDTPRSGRSVCSHSLSFPSVRVLPRLKVAPHASINSRNALLSTLNKLIKLFIRSSPTAVSVFLSIIQHHDTEPRPVRFALDADGAVILRAASNTPEDTEWSFATAAEVPSTREHDAILSCWVINGSFTWLSELFVALLDVCSLAVLTLSSSSRQTLLLPPPPPWHLCSFRL